MKKHLPLVILRFAIAYCIAEALPFAHMRLGHQYPGDGQQAFGFVVAFYAIGLAAAAVFVLAASLWHYVRRRRSPIGIAAADLLIGACSIAVLGYVGAMITYSDTLGGTADGVRTPHADMGRR